MRAELPASERRLMYGHLPRMIYSGQIGNSAHWRTFEDADMPLKLGISSYIYHLFDADGEPIYFGKTDYPSRRFVVHARKAWWKTVDYINLYVVSCESHRDEACRGFGGNTRAPIVRATMLWEAKAIRDIQPRYNIAGVPA